MEVRIPCMELGQIASSGQCFRMRKTEAGSFLILAADRYLEIQPAKEHGDRYLLSCSQEEWEGFWRQYFDLDTDYQEAVRRIDPEDHYLMKAAQTGWGLRILRQDLWEMIITFIISQRNNIPRIRRCVEAVCSRFGEEREQAGGQRYFAFPQPKALKEASLQELRECGLGYRAEYIQETARMVEEGECSLSGLKDLNHQEALLELLKLRGVGIKVAECVCLFGLHHLDAFPVDTHIAQVLKTHYPQGFPFARYQQYSGILQQYIFYYETAGKSRKEGEEG
ncbi:MAG TPA: 8-oxoguanine DNA glycosylase [Candidatus Cottocaccamicrobium excrementipullorum]|nr:8-oxoguanine DNA glycosylase [Candidatus Cottocaccamicrobium excrementipullorum]